MSDVEFETDQAQSQFAQPRAVYGEAYAGSGPNARNKTLLIGIIIACVVITVAVLFYASRRGSQASSVPWQVKMDKMQSSFGAGAR